MTDHGPTLRIRRLPLDTGRENIAIISARFAGPRTEVFRAFSRARIRNGSTEILATLITSDDPKMIAPDEIGLAEPAFRRLGQPEEVAKAIYFLCTDSSSYVTGAELHINGGQHV